LITLPYPIFVNPVRLPYKHWFVSIVKAVVELVKHIIEFVMLLYILLVPSLNKIVGLVTDEYIGEIDTVVKSSCVDVSFGKLILFILYCRYLF
jgi:hypothetical protein